MVARWTRGERDVEDMVARGDLEAIRGSATDGSRLLDESRIRLRTGSNVVEDPSGAFTLVYDAARLACTALLAQQGLRPTRSGGHIVVQDAMRAQFADGFRDYQWMRRRRNEVEYPTSPGVAVSVEELRDAIAATRGMIDHAEQLLRSLGLFHG